MLRRGVDVRAHPSDNAIRCFQLRHPKVGNLHRFMIRSKQQILRFDVAMNHAAGMSVRQTRANLLQILKCAIEFQWRLPAQHRQVTPAEILENDVMKSCSAKIDGSAMAKATDNVGMADTIEGDCLVLKILNQRPLEFGVLIALQQNVECFDYYFAKLLVGRAPIARRVDLGITATTETLFNVVTTVKPAL